MFQANSDVWNKTQEQMAKCVYRKSYIINIKSRIIIAFIYNY